VALRIEDYAMIGDTHTGALVGRDGSIDWWCTPRFDSPACFAALLGDERNGRWLITPVPGSLATRRRYLDGGLVLEMEWDTEAGSVRVTDFMPIRKDRPRIIRLVEGLSGQVTMTSELVIRFDYGHDVPWVRRVGDAMVAVAGPDALCLRTPVDVTGEDLTTVGRFTVSAGQKVPFVLTWYPSHEAPPKAVNAERELARTLEGWEEWAGACKLIQGEEVWADAVHRSLVTLKGLTYAPTGGIVAALTTSLPEALGGVRNWDYRYCWLRDATFTLYALLMAGYEEEARKWRDWLLRAIAGQPSEFQILYGPAGERRLTEYEVPWLHGYEGSAPVRVGNAASRQFQLDVFGEIMDTMAVARRVGLEESDSAWDLQRALIEHLEGVWKRPDDGIWEVRGPRRHFVHSKVMAWVAVDRAVKAVEAGRTGDATRWKRMRSQIHAEVCRDGYDTNRNTFTQFYGSAQLDAALLLLPQVGFLPPTDQRVVGTIAAIEKDLYRDGLVLRYDPGHGNVDGLPGTEGSFLPCSFWLVDAWAMSGQRDKALDLFNRLLSYRNDLGLLSEEYDTVRGRQLGNVPQAFSHLSLVNSAHNLSVGTTAVSGHRSDS